MELVQLADEVARGEESKVTFLLLLSQVHLSSYSGHHEDDGVEEDGQQPPHL